MPLKVTDTQKSLVLKVHLEEISRIALAKVIREEHPRLGLAEALYFAELLKEVHRVGVLRGKAVKNS